MGTATVMQAYIDGVAEEMRRDRRIFLLGNDLVRGGSFGQVRGLADEFGPERVRDTPISEAAISSAGVGAALNGMRPVVDFNFIDFALGAMDEIVNQAAKIRYMFGPSVPVVFRGTTGVALYAAQHNNSMESWFSHVPGLSVVMPATPADTKGLIKAALRGSDPVVYLVHKRSLGHRGEIPDGDTIIEIGSAAVPREGRDVTLITYGITVTKAETAAEHLAAKGIDVEIVDVRTLLPLDFETIDESVRKTGRALVVAEEPPYAGIAGEIAAHVQEACFDYLDAPVIRLTSAHSPIPHCPELIELLIPQADDIERAIEESIAQWPTTAAA